MPRKRSRPTASLTRMRRIAAVVLLLTACSSAGPTTQPQDPTSPAIYAYSLVAPLKASPSGLVARAVLPAASKCPQLEVQGAASVPMARRAPGTTTKGAFDDVLVCSAPIPPGATSVSVAGHSIPAAMPDEVETIAAFGDSGCLINKVVQDCRKDWPLRPLAEQIARARPDLIIHVGDYYYRERACPTDDQDKCGDSPAPPSRVPFIDSAAGWRADYLDPASPLFSVAPILAVRGNHEVCSEAGNGYFLFMDYRSGSQDVCAPRPDGKAPVVQTKPWRIDLPLITGKDLRLVVVDSAHGWDYGISPWSGRQRGLYQRAATMAKNPSGLTWLVTHQPPLAITTTKYDPGNVPDWTNWVAVDQTVASRGLLTPYDALVSGHLHLSQVVKIPGLPPQFVFGGGGTFLDPPDGYDTPKYGPLATSKGEPMVPGFKPYPRDQYRWIEVQHAFGLARPNAAQGAWDVQYVKPDGSTLATCTVRDEVPDCGAE